MSAQDGAQPPTAGPEKTQAPQSAATFSSFINKNTSGKKFAPKAARRRPGAAPPASTPVTPNASTPPSSQAAPEPTPAPAASPPASAQLPTPVSTCLEVPSQPGQAQDAPQAQPSHAADGPGADRPAKRRRTQPPVTSPSHQQPDPQATPPVQAHETAAEGGEQGSATQSVEGGDASQQLHNTGSLPWVAVNHSPGDEQTEATTVTPVNKTHQPPRPRGRRIAANTTEADDVDEQEEDEEASEQSTRIQSAAKTRNRKRMEDADAEDDFEADTSAKKPRKPRRDKGMTKTADGGVEAGAEAEAGAEGGTGQLAGSTEQGTTTRKPRKPRQPRRRKQPTVEGENGEQITQSKRRGRPPREDTPPGAEHETIDPDATFMDSLASRNIRVGKLSTLERRMRDINWEEVRQRQREEDRRIIHTKETQAAVDKLLNAAGEEMEAASAEQGPRMRVVGDRIELIHDSGAIDREAEADMQIATMEVHEEADLTTRITTRSFMKNGKRFPNDFILPGQGHRWSHEQTDRFYQGLRMYGTDFQMISMMFPNLSRRVIKTKFNREERENPDKVARCLLGELEMASGWDEFLQASELQEDHFADADEIKRQMDEVEARMRIEIEAAKAETAERKRQLKEAGLLPDGEEGDNADGKGRKKRRERGKQVTFQEEEGVEILGGLDDDPNWGQ